MYDDHGAGARDVGPIAASGTGASATDHGVSTTDGALRQSMQKALNRALFDILETDDKALVFGEDVGQLGGVFRVTEGLQAHFGARRVFDTPLAESGIVGLAVGLAMRGWHPMPE